MKRRTVFGAGVALGLLLLAAPAFAQTNYFKSSEQGNPKVKSIEAIGFGPDGLLLIGDGRGKQVVVIDTKDTMPTKWSNTKITDIQKRLAGRLGTTEKGIEIIKLAVNPTSKRVYFSVRKLGDEPQDLLLTADATGKIQLFDLENVKYARVRLPAKEPVTKITDVAWAKDRVLVSAQARDTFGSKIFSIYTPIAHDVEGTAFNTETYHVAHGRWETRAPIYAMIPYQENGKQYLVGAFTCTPVVKFKVDDLVAGAKVKGQSVIEVGFGNRPRDMFSYDKGKRKYVLMSTVRMARFHKRLPVGPSPYWVVKIDYNLLGETKNVNKKALVRVNKKYENITDRAEVVKGYHGTMFMDQLDNRRAVIVRLTANGQKNLEVLMLP